MPTSPQSPNEKEYPPDNTHDHHTEIKDDGDTHDTSEQGANLSDSQQQHDGKESE